MGVVGVRETGDVVTLSLGLKNVSDQIVDQEGAYLYWYAPHRDNPEEEEKFEEYLWKKMPTRDSGEFPSNISPYESGNSLISYRPFP